MTDSTLKYNENLEYLKETLRSINSHSELINPPVFVDKMGERGLIPAKAQQMAYEIMNHGQPFAESVLAELMRRGANTPEQNGDWLRRGMLDEAARSRILMDHERERIWHRYHVPRWKRLFYRLRLRFIHFRD